MSKTTDTPTAPPSRHRIERAVAPSGWSKNVAEGSWQTLVDLRDHPASMKNQKCYTNARIAQSNGKLPADLEIRTNGHNVLFKAYTVTSTWKVKAWLDTFRVNWSGVKF